jgi:hypothetical protein
MCGAEEMWWISVRLLSRNLQSLARPKLDKTWDGSLRAKATPDYYGAPRRPRRLLLCFCLREQYEEEGVAYISAVGRERGMWLHRQEERSVKRASIPQLGIGGRERS